MDEEKIVDAEEVDTIESEVEEIENEENEENEESEDMPGWAKNLQNSMTDLSQRMSAMENQKPKENEVQQIEIPLPPEPEQMEPEIEELIPEPEIAEPEKPKMSKGKRFLNWLM